MIVEERKNITTNGKYVRGSLLSYQLDTFGFKGRTDNQNISIEVYESGVFRIRISKNDEFDNFDYALEKDINPKSIDYLEKEDSIIISTGTVELTIMKTPFRVVFRNEKAKSSMKMILPSVLHGSVSKSLPTKNFNQMKNLLGLVKKQDL